MTRTTYVFRLFLAGHERNSELARTNLTRLCGTHLKGRHRVEIVDVLKNTALALKLRVLVTPTLMLVRPRPEVTVLGNLNDTTELLAALRLGGGAMRARNSPEALAHVLKTHQVDAIVGERDVMLVRLRQVEAELERSRDELRALAGRLQVQRDHERAAVAREIHDEMGQALTSLQLGLSWVAQALPAGQPVQTKIRSLTALVTTTIRSVKRIAVELRPGVLDELGLVKTLRSEARAFQGHTGIRCAFKTNLSKATCRPAASLAVFRIAQAALTNVARHARASRAGMTLMTRGPDLVLTVTDNGRGLAKTIGNGDALGIVGMRERAMALDGTLTLSGPRGQGTTVTVRVPLSHVLAGRTPRRRSV